MDNQPPASPTPPSPPAPASNKQRHDQSVKDYPDLNLSENEYVILAVKYHPIGLIQIWVVVAILLLALFSLFGWPLLHGGGNGFTSGVLLFGASILFILGGMLATSVYKSNRFYITNEAVIQRTQSTPFSKHEQTIRLSNIEDTSYKQGGMFQMALDYGTIHLSTEGTPTHYKFGYVGAPKKIIDTLDNAIEAFKNSHFE